MNAYIIASSRVVQNLAREYSLPRLSRLNARGTPALSLALCCGITIGLLFFSNQFSTLAVLSVITTLLPYISFCLVAFVLFPEKHRKIVSGLGALLTAAILVLFFIYR